jgi:trigger factor
VELDVPEVDKAFDEVARDFVKHATLPGFRPGKAPRDMVLKKYTSDIGAEVKKKILGDSYKKAVAEHKLEVLGYPDIEEIGDGSVKAGTPFQYLANIEIEPEIQLPEYKGIPVKRELATVTEADVDRAVGLLREKHAKFEPAARPAQQGDVVVVNYTGTCEGQPITAIAPAAKGLTEQKAFWVNLAPGSFLPGFPEKLSGAKAGDKLTIEVSFPADFNPKPLAGKQGHYEVEVVEVRERILPPVDEAFAKQWDAASLEKLLEGVRRDLQNELEYKKSRGVRGQIIQSLLSRVTFDLPESAVAQETRNVVYDLVRDNTQRGVSRDLIEQQKDEIYLAAAQNAKDRVKFSFLIQKIAEKEDIKVSNEEVSHRVLTLANTYNIAPEKFIKDLQKRNGLVQIYDQVAQEKVLTFLEKNAVIEDVPAGAAPTPPPA